MKIKNFCSLQPGVQHVVRIPNPGHGFAFDRSAMLYKREYIGQHLTGMMFVGQSVDHRHARAAGEAFDNIVAKGA